MKNHLSDRPIELKVDEATFNEKLSKVRAWIFDWDGIFNDGRKTHEKNNLFNERDSMGTNLLRFVHYLRHGTQPFTGIVTGGANQAPQVFAHREHFHAVATDAKYKRDIVIHLMESWGVEAEEVGFFFDDILDFNVCEIVGFRAQIRYASSPSVSRYVDEHHLTDMVTHVPGDRQGLRTLIDYLIDHMGMADRAIADRMHMSESYLRYFHDRQEIKTNFYKREDLIKNNIGV